MTETFFPQDNTLDTVLVELAGTSMDLHTLSVEYRGNTYTLHWNSRRHRYEGQVADNVGYVL